MRCVLYDYEFSILTEKALVKKKIFFLEQRDVK